MAQGNQGCGGGRGWLWKLALSLFVLLVPAPILLLLIFRFLPVPGTPEMLVSLVEGKGAHYAWSDDISPRLERAVIGAEDQNFCTHHGFDWAGINKAMEDHKRHPDKPMRGASTISQQTARTLFLVPIAQLDPQGAGGLSDRADGSAVAQEAHPAPPI